jgi:hypothetical protein
MARQKRDDLEFLRDAAALWGTDEQDIGYLARVFAQTSLPYRDPGPVPAWGRRNGDLSLVIQPGVSLDARGLPCSIGYPYGVIPRLLITWLSTEAVRTKQRELVLGESLADFMRQIGLTPTGGKTGTITRLRKHMERLFLATLVVRYDGHPDRDIGARMGVATQYDLWWSARDPRQPALLPSYVRLSDEFFTEATTRPVPVSIDALRLLRGSALRLDIYSWLTYRMSYLRRRSEIPWSALRFQFGSQMADTKQGRQQFRRDFERQLAKVLAVYPDANVEVALGGLVLLPSRTHVGRGSRPALGS